MYLPREILQIIRLMGKANTSDGRTDRSEYKPILQHSPKMNDQVSKQFKVIADSEYLEHLSIRHCLKSVGLTSYRQL